MASLQLHKRWPLPERWPARKYWKTAAMAAASYVGDSPLFLMDYALRFARVAVLLALWRVILGGRGEVSGLTVASVLTYTLIAEVFADQLDCRIGMETAIWEGTIATRLLQPLGLVGVFAAEAFGRWAFAFCLFSLPLLLASPLLGVSPLPASPGAAALFLPSLGLAVVIGLALEFIFGALVVALDQSVWVVQGIRDAVATLLSGSLLPLALYPWGLGELFSWLPFASTASAPLRVYTGTGDPLRLLLIQAGWAIVLWPLALWLWRANRERLASYGG